MSSFYGRKVTSDVGFGTTGSGGTTSNQRYSVFGAMPEDGWGFRMYLLAGKTGGTAPNMRLAIANLDGSGNPNRRMAYTAQVTVSATATYGGDATVYPATISQVGSSYGPSNAGVMLHAGTAYALGFAETGAQLLHGMIDAANPNNTYPNQYMYFRDVASTTPTDPVGYTFSSYEGVISIAIEYDANVAPNTPTGLTSGNVSTLTPTLQSNFSDANSVRGDSLKQYKMQLRILGQTTNKWSSPTISATNAEVTANQTSYVYNGSALSGGVSYQWRIQHSDQFDTWSAWSAWTTITVNGGGSVAAPTSPSGKQLTVTPGPYNGVWSHASGLQAKAIRVQIKQGGTVIRGPYTYNLPANVSVGGTLSATYANLGSFTPLSWGAAYTVEIAGQDTTNLWSDYSVGTPFTTDYYPATPGSLSPAGSAIVSAPPKLTGKTTDPDDATLTVSARIKDAAGNVLVTRAMALRAGTTDTYDYQTIQGVNEVQLLTRGGTISGGTFTITVPANVLGGPFTTAAINWNDTAATIQTRLEALANVGVGNVAVTGGPVSTTNVTLTFQNALGGNNLSQVTVTSSLTGTAPTLTPSTTTNGVANDIPTYATYKWDMIATDGTLTSAYSPEATFVFGQGPTVTITAPTGFISTATPLITWTATGQAKYQVYIYAAGTTNLVYTSGLVVSATQSHQVPAGYLHNTVSYDVVVAVTNAVPLTGQNQAVNFTVSYPALAPSTSFVASPYQIAGDPKPTAMLLTWDYPPEAPETFVQWVLKRRNQGTPAGDPSEIILRRIYSIGQNAYVDYLPESGKAYTYSLVRSVYQGTDQTDSPEATYDAMVSFDHIVICSATDGGSYRVALRILKAGGVDHKDQIALQYPWGDPEPTIFTGNTNYDILTGTYQVITDRYGIALDVMDDLEAIQERQTNPLIGDVMVYRDNRRRKLFGWMQYKETDNPLVQFSVDITFTETNAKEGQS